MQQIKKCIEIFSVTNTFIDFCVVLDDNEDASKVCEIVNKAFNYYWNDDDTQFDSLADYIKHVLREEGIKFEIYFKEEDDVD